MRIDRSSVAFFCFMALLGASLPAGADEPAPAWVDEAREEARAFGSQLKQALLGALQRGGPTEAVEACQMQAPAIADAASSPEMQIRRTALRVRNPANQPDAWEARVLADFGRRIDAGEDLASLETFVLRRSGSQRSAHWMKAIPTEAMCLTCHGEALAADIQSAIDQRYPEDQAIGFAAGSLRGAFSVQIALPDAD